MVKLLVRAVPYVNLTFIKIIIHRLLQSLADMKIPLSAKFMKNIHVYNYKFQLIKMIHYPTSRRVRLTE